MLTGIIAIDPAKYPLFLTRRETTWPSGRRPGRNSADPNPWLGHRRQPFVDRRPAEPVGCDDRRWRLAFAHALDRHEPDGFQRLVIELSSVSLHDPLNHNAR